MRGATYILTLCCMLAFPNLLAQHVEVKISGIVKDSKTLLAVPYATINSSHAGTFSNTEGVFTIMALSSDTLIFSHLNYEKYTVPIKDMVDHTVSVYLLPKDILMHELLIFGLPSEEKFKRNILDTRVVPSVEQVNAQTNVGHAKVLFLSGYTPSMNSEDNYRNYIQGPQGVNILSTHPSKGLFKAFRNISYHKRMLKPAEVNPPLISNDSIVHDSIPQNTHEKPSY